MTQKSRSRWIRAAILLALASAGSAVMALAQETRAELQARFDRLAAAVPTNAVDAERVSGEMWAVGEQLTEMNREYLHAVTEQLAAATAVAAYRRDGAAVLNDLRATPGEADAQLTKETLCARTFHTRDERSVTESQKKRICAAYGQMSGCPGRGYEIDHLISIELGGSNGDANLWPQPVDAAGVIGFHTKDKVENALHRRVCAGELPLDEAQRCIARDWYACARREGVLP